jgi:STE24 endopeptidase
VIARRQRSWVYALFSSVLAAEISYLLLRPRGATVTPASVRLEDYFSTEEVSRARAYERGQRALGAAQTVVSTASLAALARRARVPLRTQGAAGAARGGAQLSLTLAAVALPLGTLSRRRALDAGLATQSWRGWSADLARAGALGATLAGAGAGALWLLIDRQGSRWWQGAAAGSLALAIVASFAGPVVLDPIFNDFEALPEGELRRSVLELASRAGVTVGEVFSVDASRRTNAVNAYVGGLGTTRRIVLFDTLIGNFSPAETNLVVAHELAHVRHRDVARGLLFVALVAPALTRATARLAGVFVPGGDEADATLPGLALAGALAASLTGLIARQLSRSVERRADAFALELTGDPDTFISFEQQITRRNLADPQPPRWHSLLLATHPPALERIGAAAAFKAAGA